MATKEERIKVIDSGVRQMFDIPASIKVRDDVCLHCCIMQATPNGRAEELCKQLTDVLKQNGVNPETVINAARAEGVKNIFFKDGLVSVPFGIHKYLLIEPSWHRLLSFDFLMELVNRHS